MDFGARAQLADEAQRRFEKRRVTVVNDPHRKTRRRSYQGVAVELAVVGFVETLTVGLPEPLVDALSHPEERTGVLAEHVAIGGETIVPRHIHIVVADVL